MPVVKVIYGGGFKGQIEGVGVVCSSAESAIVQHLSYCHCPIANDTFPLLPSLHLGWQDVEKNTADSPPPPPAYPPSPLPPPPHTHPSPPHRSCSLSRLQPCSVLILRRVEARYRANLKCTLQLWPICHFLLFQFCFCLCLAASVCLSVSVSLSLFLCLCFSVSLSLSLKRQMYYSHHCS